MGSVAIHCEVKRRTKQLARARNEGETGARTGAEGMKITFFGGLLPFKPRAALSDVFAGLTLASMNIPQVLGYTRIAGTPVVTGLYTVLLPLAGFALFGSSRHLVVAADFATAAIFSSSLSRMAPLASEHYMALVGMLTLLTAGASAGGARVQARISRRLPFAHRPHRISGRRRGSGRRRRCSAACWASASPRTARPGSFGSSRSGAVVRARKVAACRSSSWPASCSAAVRAAFSGVAGRSSSGRSRRARGFISPNTALPSSARSPAACRRSNGRT